MANCARLRDRKLEEYRTAPISDAVTNKIYVRGFNYRYAMTLKIMPLEDFVQQPEPNLY